MTARSLRDLLLMVISFPLAIGLLPANWVQTIMGQADNVSAYSVPTSQPLSPVQSAVRPYHVGIQIGHYKENELPADLARLADNTGTSGGGRSEVDLNYQVSNLVASMLRAQGVKVDVLPATVPSGYAADAFVAIHADGNVSSAPRGFKISTRWSSLVAWQDGQLVETLTGAYRAATGLPEDGAVTMNMRGYYAYSSRRANYRVSNFTPSAIVEMGYMTNSSDRAVMFYQTNKVAAGIVNGIMNFLKATYGSPAVDKAYGFGEGIVDKDVNPLATPIPTPRPGTSQQRPGGFHNPRPQTGNWQVLLMGKPTISIYSGPGGEGPVVAQLPRDQFLHSSLRQGDYYQVDLPGGKQGWVNRYAIVVQTQQR